MAKQSKKKSKHGDICKPPPAPVPVVAIPLNKQLQVHAAVWAAYVEYHTVRGVCNHTGYGYDVVVDVLNADKPRLAAMLNMYMEEFVGRWEKLQSRSLDLIDRVLAHFQNLLTEIETAAKENRITHILNAKGEPMPVLEAMEYLVMTRVLDQILRVAEVGRKISQEYRGPRLEVVSDMREQVARELDPVAVAKEMQRVGLTLPPLLAEKLRAEKIREARQAES